MEPPRFRSGSKGGFAVQWISDAEIQRAMEVPHFAGSHYADWDLNQLFGFYVVNFVEQLDAFSRGRPIRKIADIGTGYGWLAIAFALHTKADIVAVDMNEERLVAARELAAIMGVSPDRIEWLGGSVDRLPFGDREIDATYCIEVIEHAGDTAPVVRDLARVTSNLLTITTPNRSFPIIHHDTRLPMCHWLPPGRLRDIYARAFGRLEMQDNNRFWSGRRLLSSLPEFERVSTTLQFPSFAAYRGAQDQLDPQRQRYGRALGGMQEMYYRAASVAGRRSIHVMPNLASTLRRVGD